MKIIKKGTPPEERTHRFTCKHCYTIFEALGIECDIRKGYVSNYAVWANCPVCNEACRSDS